MKIYQSRLLSRSQELLEKRVNGVTGFAPDRQAHALPRGNISGVWKMKIDLSPEAVTKRLKIVNELRRTCLSLANSEAGKEIMKKCAANKSVKRTSLALGR